MQGRDAGDDRLGDEQVHQQPDHCGCLVAQQGPQTNAEQGEPCDRCADAGRPNSDTAADTISEVVGAAVTAIAAASSSG
jgi:hypothetical protein